VTASAPNAVPAFMSIAAAALPANFSVQLSQTEGVYIAPQSLLITGAHFTEDEIVLLGPDYRHEEHYTIGCSLFSSAGTGIADQPTRMAEVYALYADVSIAVASHPDLNSTVLVAWTRQLDYTPTYDSKGMSVGQLDFEVSCIARVQSLA
jgi:hypothetical protein